MMVNFLQIKFQATIYRFGLDCGLFTKNEVIGWCDRLIESLDNPPYEIIELSLMGKKSISDLTQKLIEIGDLSDLKKVVKILLAILNHKFNLNEISLKEAIKSSYHLLMITNLWDEAEFYSLYWMDDEYELAANGIYSNIDNVEEAFKTIISSYEFYYDEAQKIIIM